MGEFTIGEALKQFLDQSRIKGGIQALQIEDAWEAIMGKTIAKYTDSIRISGTILFIHTTVAPLRHELIFQKEKIKTRVNETLGYQAVTDVIIK